MTVAGSSGPGNADSWDDMRARTWDNPDASFQGLLSALGVGGKRISEQQDALRRWLHSAPARPAPKTLLAEVRKFLAVAGG